MLVVPDGSCTLDQNRFRKPPGARALLVDPEDLQIALVRRDTTGDDRRNRSVLLGALPERLVVLTARGVRLANLCDIGPIERTGIVDLQVRVGVDLEVAAGQTDLWM